MCHFDTVAECHKHCQFVFYWGQTSSQQPPVSTVRYCNEAEKVIHFSAEDCQQLETYGGKMANQCFWQFSSDY